MFIRTLEHTFVSTIYIRNKYIAQSWTEYHAQEYYKKKENRPDDTKREEREREMNNHFTTTYSRHKLARPTEISESEGMRCPDGWLPPLDSIPH